MEDCFSFGALPILVIALFFVGAGVARERLTAPQHAAALATVSLPGANPASRPNIILVVSDALRAQSMSLYGRTRTTTPELDRWAQAATVYLEAHSNSTSTKPSMTAILTGKHPLSHGRLTKGQPPYGSSENLLQILRDYGYHVGAVTSNEDASLRLLGFNSFLSENEFTAFEFLSLAWLRRYGIHPTPTGGRMYQNLAQYFWFLGYPERTSYYGFAEDTVKAAENFIRKAEQPFFLLIHMHEPHDPYEASPAFRRSYSRNWPANFEPEISSSYYGRYDAKLQPSANFYRDQYEESIRYLDSELGKFFRIAETLVPNQNSAIIFTGDHGESFERGFMNHGEDVWEP
ncbi:MAG TPA: sulfatase-like hydrolase/transferase, partial [Candidatus Binatus sp.]|nr:sulfatase-like hydrolase/transferase [Candidatus Binatus sp.]